jgi:peptidoglycan/LPS O-acetylase OafA/YrhL
MLQLRVAPLDLAFGDPWFNFGAYFPLFHLPQFIFGMALGRCFICRRSDPSSRTCDLISAAGLAVLCIVVLFKSDAPWLLRSPVLVVVFGAIIFGCAGGVGAVTKALSFRWLVLLGEASYATYILHVPLLLWWQWAQKVFRYHLAPNVDFAVSLGGVIMASLLVMVLVEKPTRATIVARFAGKRQRIQPEAAFSN